MTHDPGGKRSFALRPGVKARVLFSEDLTRRYLLERRRDSVPTDAPSALWIGMNPSTADGYRDDPTVRFEWLYTSEDLNIGRYIKANIVPYRATSPADMHQVLDHHLHRNLNLRRVLMAAQRCRVVIFTCGVMPERFHPYIEEMYDRLTAMGKTVQCLGTGNAGWPRHPRGLARATKLEPWNPPWLKQRNNA